MHALSYSTNPAALLHEAARVLRPGGRLVVATLRRHQHEETQRAYDHVNLGLEPDELRALIESTALSVEECRVTSREARPPYFEVVTVLADKGS